MSVKWAEQTRGEPGVKAYINWSGGKDCTLALHRAEESGMAVNRLVTLANAHYRRVTMQGIRQEVIEAQAACLGRQLDVFHSPRTMTTEEYNALSIEKVQALRAEGYDCAVSGDIFLQELRELRIKQTQPYGVEPRFPLWGCDTGALLRDFIDLGYRAVIVCKDNTKLDESFLGAEITHSLLDKLPEGVDTCGERGEYQSFCFDGPLFQQPVSFRLGETVQLNYNSPQCDLTAIDLLPA